MNTNDINAFLTVLQKRDGDKWNYTFDAGKKCWKVIYKGCTPQCTIHIEIGLKMVYFHSVLDFHIWPEHRWAVYRYLLRLNEEISGAKFGLGSNGKLSLMVEWPLEKSSFSGFENAIRIILTYYQIYYPDVQMLSQDKDVAQQILRLEKEYSGGILVNPGELKIDIIEEDHDAVRAGGL